MKTIKIVLLVITMCAFTICEAQNSRLSIGVSVYPNVSVALLTNDGTYDKDLEIMVRSREKLKLSGSATLSLHYKLSDKFDLQSGIGFQNGGYTVTGLLFEGDSTIAGLFDEAIILRNFNRIEIPINIQYNVSSTFHITAGLSPTYTISNCNTIQFKESKETTRSCYEGDNMNIYNTLINVGAGINIAETKRMTLSSEFYVQYGVFNIFQNVGLNRNLMSTGVKINCLLHH